MADKQYGVSKVEQDKILRRAQLRESLQREYLKQITDPHRHGKGEGGYVFDPAIQRFISMKATGLSQFKPTMGNFGRWMFTTIFPIAVLFTVLYRGRLEFERKCRSGEITYKDREFKFN